MFKKAIDIICEWIIDHRTLTKVVLGTLITGAMILSIYKENIIYSEKMDVAQWIISNVGIFYVCFGIPWGFAKLRMIQWEQWGKIPFIGREMYIILKIGLSCIIGTPIMIYELLKWFFNKYKKKTEDGWQKSELEREKKRKVK